jgi:hypothetical protein
MTKKKVKKRQMRVWALARIRDGYILELGGNNHAYHGDAMVIFRKKYIAMNLCKSIRDVQPKKQVVEVNLTWKCRKAKP